VERERTRESKKGRRGQRNEQPGLDQRHGDKDGQIRETNADTRIDTLRQKYGDSFAPGIRGDALLRTLLERTGSTSLSDYLKSNAPPVKPEGTEAPGESSGVRYASDAQYRKAHRKTSMVHASLFRRLAQ
jgi:hypothetical protein